MVLAVAAKEQGRVASKHVCQRLLRMAFLMRTGFAYKLVRTSSHGLRIFGILMSLEILSSQSWAHLYCPDDHDKIQVLDATSTPTNKDCLGDPLLTRTVEKVSVEESSKEQAPPPPPLPQTRTLRVPATVIEAYSRQPRLPWHGIHAHKDVAAMEELATGALYQPDPPPSTE